MEMLRNITVQGSSNRTCTISLLLFLFILSRFFLNVLADGCKLGSIKGQPGSLLTCTTPLEALNFTGSIKNVTKVEVKCSEIWKNPLPTPLPSLQFQRLKSLKIDGCGENGIRLLGNLSYDGHLNQLDLRGNQLGSFEWQLARRFRAHQLDLRNNSIECSCANKWIFDFQSSMISHNNTLVASFLQLPTQTTINDYSRKLECHAECPNEDIQLQPPIINTTLNSMAVLTCKMNGKMDKRQDFKPEDLFRWPAGTNEASEERKKRWKIVSENANVYKMEIWNLTSNDLGIVICECLQCVAPIYAQSEFRFDTMITSRIDEDSENTHLTIHGYPLRNLTMTLTRLDDLKKETKRLPVRMTEASDVLFFDNMITVRYNPDHSQVSLKYFHFIVSPEAKTYDYGMSVCTPRSNDCNNANLTLRHPVTIGSINNDSGNQSSGKSMLVPLFFTLLILGALGALMVSIFHYYRRDKTASKLATAVGWHKGRLRRVSRNTNRTEETSLRMDDSLSATMSNYSLQHVPVISKDHLVLEEKIGKGQFGEVFTGEWITKGVRVAVKILHNVQVDAQMDKEAAMLAALDHENVVKMFGVCRATEQQNIYLVLELMNMGDLKTYIKLREPQCDNYSQFPPALLTTELINIAQQICNGLCYIHMQQIVHRDFAARNCLVSGESDFRSCAAAFRPPVTVKISDFGMSRRLYSQAEYYKMGDNKTALPVRWLPPESLESGRFTYQSDMWAFGVTLFELFTFGAMPYGDLSNNESLMAIISGVRPTIPPKCPAEIAEIMKECWSLIPDERPTADDALIRLKMIQ